MAYQIPQQLEYKERIMFGLDFKQLGYLFLFGFIALIFFKKINNFYLKFFLCLIPSVLGICFMFFNLDKLIKDYYAFLKKRKIENRDDLIRDFIGVKDVKDNIIFTQSPTDKF